MSLPRSVAEVLREHVTLEVECIDRMYLNAYVPGLQYESDNAKLCFNGHEYVKRQLTKRGIAYEALDNGILSCAEPRRLQALCDGLSADKIDAFFRKWLQRLPHPFIPADRRAGYQYELSILQAEFSLTQVLDRPLSGRLLFEDLIRENLDLGRPDRVQLIFDRRVTRQTPGRFRTRVLTEGVVPSLHVSYKSSDLATVMPDTAPNDSTLRRAFERLEHAMDDWCAEAKLVA